MGSFQKFHVLKSSCSKNVFKNSNVEDLGSANKYYCTTSGKKVVRAAL
jgi:hypothetical protein